MNKIEEYIDLIDNKYKEAKKARLSRFDIKWGLWSREMNIKIKNHIDENHPKSLELRLVFIYWTIKSQLLELYHKNKLGSIGLKKKFEKEAREHKKTILTSGLINEGTS